MIYKDPKLFKSDLLRTNLSEPSFEKGLLIVGDFGIRKIAIMETFEKVFKSTTKVFRSTTANNVVEDMKNVRTHLRSLIFGKNSQRKLFILTMLRHNVLLTTMEM